MTNHNLWSTSLILVMALGAGCQHDLHRTPPDLPLESAELVEEFWPDGQLRLRKEVIRRADGSLLDHGTFEQWHDNGEMEYEAVFVDGKKEGTTIRYHKNGRKATQQEYHDGKRHRRSVSWDFEGVMVKEENWADGRPHGTWTIWENGKIKWRHTYIHGDPEP